MDAEDSPDNTVLIHHSTRRLTPTISQHTFHPFPQNRDHISWRPSQHLELQFPADLDLIGGEKALDDERRRIRVTPCSPPLRMTRPPRDGDCEKEHEDDDGMVVFITRSGSVTGLVGLPRFRSLTVQVVGAGGGFDLGGLSSSSLPPPHSPPACLVCVAGGIGICAFLSFSSISRSHGVPRRTLLWSLHADDFELLPHILRQRFLDRCQWTTIRIFLTSGVEPLERKTLTSLGQKCDDIAAQVRKSGTPTTLHFSFGRMAMADLSAAATAEDRELGEGKSSKNTLLSHPASPPTVLFCGSKALEWQIKMWALKMTPPWPIQTTQIQR
ncbi:uncharacterized protein PV07_06108 [Cladophialophora immunda]|uniref:Ferric reductase NAD binding domain-containing protein n=1 Tax=Cladophialophora immunda TaxID=569365 RepID=A0A0D2CGU1_9EURO|nr:uncharacterized protein PV07_06108 [Cladophialophora immunda]KIW30358.1 hypothetical protein PV07_06108 [Cladophialophora immunda]OQV04728.1 hypothetical protein CLAIMM_09573 [Cladophialophora immunda]